MNSEPGRMFVSPGGIVRSRTRRTWLGIGVLKLIDENVSVSVLDASPDVVAFFEEIDEPDEGIVVGGRCRRVGVL